MAPRLVWKTRGCTYDIQLWKKFSRTATCFEQVQNCWHSCWRMASPPLQGLPRISSQTLQSDGASRKLSFLKNKSWISRNDTTKTQLMSLFVVGEPTSASVPHQHQLEGGHVFACCHLGVESNICNFGNWNHTVTSIPLKQSVNCSETRISQYCVTNQLLLTRNSLDKTTVATRSMEKCQSHSC